MTWFNTSYLNKKKLTIDHTKVSTADQSSFPMRVSRTDADLKVSGSGGLVQNSSGFDIIFTDSTETTKLDHEIEKYVSTTGEIEMWLRVPTASHTTDTDIYMYFNNSSISTSQENKTGVWDSNYVGVWHLKESTGSNPADSTSNAITATQNNSPTQGAGQIDGSLTFNGSTQYLDLSNPSVLRPASFPMTVSAWINITTIATTNAIFTNNKSGNGNHSGVWMQVNTAGKIELHYGSNTSGISTGRRTKTGITVLSTSTWYYVVGVIRGATDMTIYVNGVDDGGAYTGTGGALAYNTGLNGNIARIGDTPSGFFFMSGTQDDTRFSKSERLAGWVVTEYNSQNSPSTFYSVGPSVSQRIIPSTAALLQTSTRTIPSTASLTTGGTRTIPSTVALLQTNNRTIPSTSALLQTSARTIQSTAALARARTIPSSAALLQTSKRTIVSSVALASAPPPPPADMNAQLIYVQQSQLITASGNSGPLTVGYLGEIALGINITGNQGTSPTIQFFIDRLGTDGVYYPIYDSTPITTAPTVKIASTGAGLGSASSFCGTIQVRWAIGGLSSPGWTYSLSLVGK